MLKEQNVWSAYMREEIVTHLTAKPTVLTLSLSSITKMEFLTIIIAVAVGYLIGRFTYDFLSGTRVHSPGAEFLEELNRAKKENRGVLTVNDIARVIESSSHKDT